MYSQWFQSKSGKNNNQLNQTQTFCSTGGFQFSSVAQQSLTLCDPVACRTPGFRVHHQLQGLAQTHVHRVTDAIQPSYPLSSPSPLPSIKTMRGRYFTVQGTLKSLLQHHSSKASTRGILNSSFHSVKIFSYHLFISVLIFFMVF